MYFSAMETMADIFNRIGREQQFTIVAFSLIGGGDQFSKKSIHPPICTTSQRQVIKSLWISVVSLRRARLCPEAWLSAARLTHSVGEWPARYHVVCHLGLRIDRAATY